jgi:hypothetical protein
MKIGSKGGLEELKRCLRELIRASKRPIGSVGGSVELKRTDFG